MKKPTLSIMSQEEIPVQDNLITHKPWFNGMHKFFTVKIQPKRLDTEEITTQ